MVQSIGVGIGSILLNVDMAIGIHRVGKLIEDSAVAPHHYFVLLQLHIAHQARKLLAVRLLHLQVVGIYDFNLFGFALGGSKEAEEIKNDK